MKIVLDGMGGDFAPANVVAGLSLALKRSRDLEVFLVGIPEKLRLFLQEHNLENDPRIEIVPASQVVMMEDAPAVCLRSKRDSSITVGSRLLKEKKAQTLVSAGHTGATVAATVVQNRTIPGIERPGIATRIPHEHGFFVLIDVGANPDSKPLHLAQYALLGQAYAKLCLGISHPRTGILSVGEEDHKGNELVRDTRPILERLPLDNFIGNVEGKHLFSGQ
ncbi:MAG: phosphate--acyl-ACP acyltransferase, partial [Lentisphaerae bacterium]